MPRRPVYLPFAVVLLCTAYGAAQALDPALVATGAYLGQNPQPTPEFLVNTTASGGMPDGTVALCISIDQTVLRSDTNAKFIVDGQVIDNVESWFAGGRLDAPVPYATYAAHCVSVANLSIGLHTSTVELATTSDEQCTYSWIFQVNEEMLTPEPIQLPTLASLPSLTPSPATP